MGRFRHKPSSFVDYVKSAATRIKLDILSKVSTCKGPMHQLYSVTVMLPSVLSTFECTYTLQVTDDELMDILAEYQHKDILIGRFLQVITL